MRVDALALRLVIELLSTSSRPRHRTLAAGLELQDLFEVVLGTRVRAEALPAVDQALDVRVDGLAHRGAADRLAFGFVDERVRGGARLKLSRTLRAITAYDDDSESSALFVRSIDSLSFCSHRSVL